MGREVRRVPENWQHPKDARGHYIPLHSGYARAKVEYDAMVAAEGESAAIHYFRVAPEPEDYMPEFPPETATHLMMYEDCSEGTPISPAFATPEELARWLADTKASAFGSMSAPYEAWLHTINRGSAPSAVMSGGRLRSGVQAMEETD